MSLLPQRKKTAEEIAKLRESFGVPVPGAEGGGIAPAAGGDIPPPPAPQAATAPISVPTPVEEKEESPLPRIQPPAQEEPPVSPPPAPEEPPKEKPLDPLPSEEPAAKIVRSLKRSERIPVLPAGETKTSAEAGTIPDRKAAVLPELQAGRRMSSLRKSEQGLVKVAPPKSAQDSFLPVKRHDEQELIARRLQEQAVQHPVARPRDAHPAIVVPPYLLALVAVGGIFKWDFSAAVVGSMTAIAFIMALVIFFRWPLLRHHAAFILAIVILATVFGALHFFPQLRYGT